jgi:23S rRNA (cytosine1962-C5)-methyltransferase
VILDPPSFASSESDVEQAVIGYTHLISTGAQVTAPNGILAAASCSSHIPHSLFMQIIEESISRARRKAALLGIHGQPPDHPAPLVMEELQYLKFVVMQLD